MVELDHTYQFEQLKKSSWKGSDEMLWLRGDQYSKTVVNEVPKDVSNIFQAYGDFDGIFNGCVTGFTMPTFYDGCNTCKKKIKADDKFCPGCKQKIVDGSTHLEFHTTLQILKEGDSDTITNVFTWRDLLGIEIKTKTEDYLDEMELFNGKNMQIKYKEKNAETEHDEEDVNAVAIKLLDYDPSTELDKESDERKAVKDAPEKTLTRNEKKKRT